MGSYHSFLYCNFVIYEDNEWFWSLNYNALFARNVKAKKAVRISEYMLCKGSAYNNVILYEGKIIAVPGRARTIMIFDCSSRIFRFVEVEIPGLQKECNLFYGYAIWNDWLFMIGSQVPYILKFNMKTETVEDIVCLERSSAERRFYFRDAVLVKNDLVIPDAEDNFIYIMDINSLQWTGCKIKQSPSGFSAVCKDNNSVWFMPNRQNTILQWCREKNTILEYDIGEAGYRCPPSETNFHSGICLDNKMWIIPYGGNMVLSIDTETGRISKKNAVNQFLNTIRTSEFKGCTFRSAQVISGAIYLLCTYSGAGQVLIYNPQTDEIEIRESGNEISDEDYLEYLNHQECFIVNEEDHSLEAFIRFVITHSAEKKSKREIDKGYGAQIYNLTRNR